MRPGLCPRLLRKTGRLLVAQDVCASAAFPPRLGAAVKTSPKYRGAVRMPVLYAPILEMSGGAPTITSSQQ